LKVLLADPDAGITHHAVHEDECEKNDEGRRMEGSFVQLLVPLTIHGLPCEYPLRESYYDRNADGENFTGQCDHLELAIGYDF
jgi:hypothetical protein